MSSFKELYRKVLRLHCRLPADMQIIGDGYAKAEFRQHLSKADEVQMQEFCQQWTSYCETLSHQIQATGPIGSPLRSDSELTPEQVLQLSHLQAATSKHNE